MTCVGLTVLDVVQRVDCPVSWGRKSVSTSAEVTVGGPAANAAICVAKLLGTATLVTGVGGGAMAELVRAELEAWNVHLIDLAPAGWRLPVASCLVGADGERTVVAPGALATSWSLNAQARQAIDVAGALLVDGHHPVAAEEALRSVEECRVQQGRAPLTLVDAGSVKAHVQEWLPLLDIVAGSADYAAGLTESPEAAMELVLTAGAGAVVMTDGPGDIRWATAQGDRGCMRPPRVTAVDTLGAGDAFHGALAAGMATGMGLADAVALAAETASCRVAYEGARAWMSSVSLLP
ncbi:PfkB family carbohydrate kinase [Austwickia chelonae]|uniref:PfkB family carbohydrate kinase n=1 Tax=Austwickia chelonae TaxID=100225 RepID=UPI0013C2ED02|nr:PfkB family carbohydrate kinase [Austwickia chelonae]